jgi:hypothetical protein
MRRGATALALCALGITTAGCTRRADAVACQAILDRYVRMGAGDDPGLRALPPAQAELVLEERLRARRATPAYVDAASRCANEVSADEAACALKANSPGDWEACLE